MNIIIRENEREGNMLLGKELFEKELKEQIIEDSNTLDMYREYIDDQHTGTSITNVKTNSPGSKKNTIAFLLLIIFSIFITPKSNYRQKHTFINFNNHLFNLSP